MTKSKTKVNILYVWGFLSVLMWPGQFVCAQETANRLVVSITPQQPIEKRVTVKLHDVTLKQFFDEMNRQTGLNFIFNADQLKQLPKISVNETNAEVKTVLDKVLRSVQCTYQVRGNVITVTRGKATHPVRGTVVDSEGEPLIGVSVKIAAKNTGVVTDTDGRFFIDNVEDGCILTFTYLGKKTLERRVSDNTLKIVMEDETQSINDVVVTGMFNKSRESYTGAVSSITHKELKAFRGQNMLQTLRNVDASINLAIDNLNGSNPNNIPDINIRGNSSLPLSVQEFNEGVKNELNTPLIIMDGFEISLTQLMDYNDSDIESINILKDAAATAIYGSRGANGVIVIISRKPAVGKLKVNGTIGLNIEAPDLTSYHLLNAADKLELERLAGLYQLNGQPTYTLGYEEQYNKRLRGVLSGIDTDWLSKPLHTGVGQRYNLRLEGGSNDFRWSVGTDYNITDGAMKDSNRKVFNGTITLMYNINNLVFRNQTNIGFMKAHESKYGSFDTYAKQQPYNPAYDTDGNLIRYFDSFWPGGTPLQNPLYDATLNSFDKNKYTQITNNFSVEWLIWDGLRLRGQLGVSNNSRASDNFLPAEHSYFTTRPEYQTDEGYFRRGSYRYGTGESTNIDGSVNLSYSKLIAEKHQIFLGLDYSMSNAHSYGYTFEAEGYTNEGMDFLGNAIQYRKGGSPSGTRSTIRRIGMTGNLNYTFDNRYYIDFSFRRDGSSNYGTNRRYAPFWSGGIGWNLHNERFLKNSSFINTLRLKASYGQTGSMTQSNLQTETNYKYITNNKYLNHIGAYLNALGNPDLTWQKTIQTNLGIEFGLFNGRINGSFDRYTKTTNNLLSNMDIPLSMGFSSYAQNVGKVRNNGWEMALSAYLLRNTQKRFSWMARFQLVHNNNKIVKLSDAIKEQNEEYLKQNVAVSSLFYEGRPQYSIYAVRSLGIDPSSGKELFLDKDDEITTTWNAGDKVFLGSAEPTYRGIAGTMLTWKGLSVNLSFAYHWGGKTYNQTLNDKVEVTTWVIAQQNVDERVFNDRWQKVGDVTFFKGFSQVATQATSRYVMDDNVLELQSIDIQYRFDSPRFRKLTHFSDITFGLNMSDILHFSSIKMERGTAYPFARGIRGTVSFTF